jgi:superfamily II DNA or RNA helicase
MKCIVTGVIEIYGATQAEARQIKEHLSVDDPEYHKKLRINPKARFYLSPQYKFYEEKAGVLTVPRGIGKWLVNTFPAAAFEVNTVTATHEYEFAEPIVLRENQVGVPEAIVAARQGLAVLPTGFGKTIIGLSVIKALGQRALVLAPTTPVKEQFIEDIKKYFGFNPNRADAPIHVRTPQWVNSHAKRGDFDGSRYGVVIYDECDGAVADGARRVWKYLPARFRYGFTGTLDRTDGKGPAIPFYFGDTLVERTETLIAPRIILHQYGGGGAIDAYHKMTQELSEDQERNEGIAALVERGKKTLILTKRVEHYKALAAMMPSGTKAFPIDSDANKKERAELLASFRNGTADFDVLLSTYALLGRGADIPSLDTLILAGDLKSHVLQRQAAGRILRLFEGKEPVIHDIVDVSNPILFKQAKARQKVYKSKNWPTSVCPMKSTTQSLFPKDLRHLFENVSTGSATPSAAPSL